MKKLLSLLLTAVMTVSMITSAIPVSAEENADADQQNNSSVGSEVSVEGTNSLGDLLTDAISEEAEEQQQNNGCNVFSVEMNGNYAIVDYEAQKAGNIVVGIYDETGTRLINSGIVSISAAQGMNQVQVYINPLPQYFYIKAFMVDQNYHPLCTVYESPNYTKSMQEFFSKTTEDFDPERVLNVDDDNTTNFAVYNENVKLIPYVAGVNTVASEDSENSVYVIENANEQFTSLKEDDIFAYKYGDNDFLVVKVGNIEIDGTTVTITGKETALSEVFEYVRLEGPGEDAVFEMDESTCGEGVTYEGEWDKDEDISGRTQSQAIADYENSAHIDTMKFNIKDTTTLPNQNPIGGSNDSGTKKVEFTGTLALETDIYFKVYVDWTYQYLELKIDYEAILSISLTGKYEKKLPIATPKWTFYGLINLELGIDAFIEFSAKFEVALPFTGTLGFVAESGNDLRSLCTTPTVKSPEIKAELSAYAGIALSPNINILSKDVAKGMVTVKGGVQIKGVLKTEVLPTAKRHNCIMCIDGSTAIVVKSYLEASFGPKSWDLKWKLELPDLKGFENDFYYSFDLMKFGWGDCQNYGYRTRISAVDERGAKLPAALVTVTNSNGEVVKYNKNNSVRTNSSGYVDYYLSNGTYKIDVSKGSSGSGSKSITVSDSAQEVSVPICVQTVKVVDSNNNPVKNIDVEIIQVKDEKGLSVNGTPEKYKTQNDGTFTVYLENGTYSLTAEDKDKGSGSVILTVSNRSKSATIKLSKKYQTITVKDSDLNKVSGAKIKIVKTKDANGKQLSRTSTFNDYTDSNGVYKIVLENGTYEITASKDGVGEGKVVLTVKNNENKKTITLKKKIVAVKANKLCAGAGSWAAIDANGGLWTWGNGSNLGQGGTTSSLYPVKIMDNVKSVSMGWYHGAAITEDGELWMWGANGDGQLGDGSVQSSNVPIKVMDNVTFVALGEYHSGAVTADGELYMWGNNTHGQLGTGATDGRSKSVPQKVMDDVKSVALGSRNTAIVKENGDLYTCGQGSEGRLGNGGEADSAVPVRIMGNVESATLGYHGCGAITQNGDYYMWGGSAYNTLAYLGLNGNLLRPTFLMGDVVSAGIGRCCGSTVVKSDGTVWSWGWNGSGNVGDGSTETRTYPVQVRFSQDAQMVSLGMHQTGCMTSDGSVYTWGNGPVGDGTTGNKTSPVKITLSTPASSSASSNSIKNTMSLSALKEILNHSIENMKYSITAESAAEVTTDDAEEPVAVTTAAVTASEETETTVTSVTETEVSEETETIASETTVSATEITEATETVVLGETVTSVSDEETSTETTVTTGETDIVSSEASSTDETTTSAVVSTTTTIITTTETTTTTIVTTTVTTTTVTSQTAEFTSLVPGETYNFYVIVGTYQYPSYYANRASSYLSPSYLAYMDQGVADENGNLNFTYSTKDNYTATTAFVKQMTVNDINDAEITVDISYNGFDQYINPTVKFDGKSLYNYSDYTISGGDTCVKNPGEYVIELTGIGDYTGTVMVPYTMLCNHEFEDDVCTLCGVLYEEEQEISDLGDKGDANNDGKVSAVDAAFIAKLVAEASISGNTVAVKDYPNADCDNNGKITAADASVIAKYIAEMALSK